MANEMQQACPEDTIAKTLAEVDKFRATLEAQLRSGVPVFAATMMVHSADPAITVENSLTFPIAEHDVEGKARYWYSLAVATRDLLIQVHSIHSVFDYGIEAQVAGALVGHPLMVAQVQRVVMELVDDSATGTGGVGGKPN